MRSTAWTERSIMMQSLQGNLALKEDVNALEQSSGGPEGLFKCGLFK
jgi:hypothetical protein